MVSVSGGTVASTGPVEESRWISIGAPWANSFPNTVTVPPGCTDDALVVSDINPTHAHASAAGVATARAATRPSAHRRTDRFIAQLPSRRVASAVRSLGGVPCAVNEECL